MEADQDGQVTAKKPLSERKTGFLIAALAGVAGGPIGLVASPLVLYLLTRVLKPKNGKQPNRFIPWALVGIAGVPLSLLPFSTPPSSKITPAPSANQGSPVSPKKPKTLVGFSANEAIQLRERADISTVFALAAGIAAAASIVTAQRLSSRNKALVKIYGPVSDLEKVIERRTLEAEIERSKAELDAEQSLRAKLAEVTDESQKEERRLMASERRLMASLERLKAELEKIEQEKTSALASFDKLTRENREEQDKARTRLNALVLEVTETNRQLAKIKEQREKERLLAEQAHSILVEAQQAIEEEQELREIGFHPRRYPDLRSAELEQKLATNRQAQKRLGSSILKDLANLSNLKRDGSVEKGRAMQKRSLTSYLRGFNGECDTLVNSVKHANIEVIHKKLRKAFDFYQKQATDIYIPWPDKLLSLRLEEADLVHENAIAKQLEREEQARIREEMREEARALREIEDAERAAEREAERLSQLLEKERKEAAQSELDEVHKQRIADLERLLQEAETNRERAISRAQQTRSGYVYVISNIGSFGEGVFKVGMTRRVDPMERVRELGDASVPFPFDVHVIIYTQDAPALENAIHNEIQNHRLNKVNVKREFFSISHDQLKAAIDRAAAETNIEYRALWTKYAEAEQYRQSLREGSQD
jgi:DNA repair exonuclease SbcCD ATPase subunit